GGGGGCGGGGALGTGAGSIHSGGYDTCRPRAAQAPGAPPAPPPRLFPSHRFRPPPMSRKPKKGYYVKGHFVAEGSELDLELKAELKGTAGSTKTDLKRESDALQQLGGELLTLRTDL